jgi:quinolinate synthase
MERRLLAAKITDLKKKKNAVLLVHNYQRGEIQDLADYVGDSLGLSQRAAEVNEPLIVFCGVSFMAETAKILSPDKTVLLPRLDATCPMAAMVNVDALKQLKAEHPDAKVVTYVNSTAEVKAESDICCTSANAVEVVQKLDTDKIIFTPDKNLAAWAQRFTEKTIIPWEGYCYVHNRFDVEEVKRAREFHPGALLMVHPECPPEIIDLADEVLSTGGMVKLASESKAQTFLVGTEAGMLYRLRKENPSKDFYSAGVAKTCRGMKATHLEDLYDSLEHGSHEINLPESVMNRARKSIQSMLDHG